MWHFMENEVEIMQQVLIMWWFSFLPKYMKGHAVVQLVEALRYKPDGREFDSWGGGYWNFSLT